MPGWTTRLLNRLVISGLANNKLERLYSSAVGNQILDYNLFMYRTMGIRNAYPGAVLGTSFPLGSKYADAINGFAIHQIHQLCCDLLDTLDKEEVQGAVVEFGVASGSWLADILDHMDRNNIYRETHGFDSFEGLPEPDRKNDGDGWEKGQYSYSLELVRETLRHSERKHLHLHKGWFSNSFRTPEARNIGNIAFAKVDCDLYAPAVECLDFITGRLSDGAILMFDDWPYVATLGETKAFMEWVPRVPQYRFEFIGFINWRIFFRVRFLSKPHAHEAP
ncbi:Macrocin-O-methyltransferase (TylF) [Nitrosovibrio sp. Nv17]|nr:Macrocin-O-methyltransferase (TylF) [Nitrosovibrio sp. Nv17]